MSYLIELLALTLAASDCLYDGSGCLRSGRGGFAQFLGRRLCPEFANVHGSAIARKIRDWRRCEWKSPRKVKKPPAETGANGVNQRFFFFKQKTAYEMDG